jgi:hypothetical protein
VTLQGNEKLSQDQQVLILIPAGSAETRPHAAVLPPAPLAGLPLRREQAHHSLTACGGAVERLAPPLTDVDARARIQVEEDLIRQPRVLLAKPLLKRLRLPVIGAGVAEE